MAFGLSPVGDFNPPAPGNFGGGAVAALVVNLIGGEIAFSDGAQFDVWSGTVLVTSSDVAWDDTTGLSFETAGVYEVSMQGSAIVAGEVTVFPQEVTVYGSMVPGAQGLEQSRYASRDDSSIAYPAMGIDSLTWHDTFTFVAAVGTTFKPSLYCQSYATFDTLNFAAVLVVRRLGDAA